MNTSKIANGLIISIAVVIILIYGKNLLIPFVIAVIFWFLIKEIREQLNKIRFIDEKVPNAFLNLFGFASIFAIIGGVVQILASNIQELSESLPLYQSNIKEITAVINSTFNIDISSSVKEFLGDYKYTKFLGKLFNSLKDVFGNAIIIIIYTLFLLLEESFFPRKIKRIYFKKEDHAEIQTILKQIDKSISRYISIKTLVSLITGLFSYIALLFIGIDAPLFWAFLIFMMNFIPTIGSLIATTFPAIFALLQFGEIMPGVWVLIIVGVIQLVMGNYVDPKFTGDSLNVSPLVVIIGLSFWGALWGILGMILSVPISVMIIIIFSEFPQTRSISILLSKKGIVGRKGFPASTIKS